MNSLFNLKSYFKFLSRNKAYTAIDVFGLSISLMFVILIGVYNQQERSIDKFNTKADRIFALCMRWPEGNITTGGHWQLQTKLKERYPEIESSCAISMSSVRLTNETGELFDTRFMMTDSTFYQIFDFQLISGDRRTALDSPEKAVITEKLAHQLFGNSNPIGKPIQLRDSVTLTVSAIMEPMDNTCLVNYKKEKADMIVSFDMMKYFSSGRAKDNIGMNDGTGSDLYFLCKPGTNLNNKRGDIEAYLKEFFWLYQIPDGAPHTELVRFSDLYFSDAGSNNGHHINGDKKMVNMLFIVGMIILLFALMNYINLTVAQAGFRVKEMATRRLLGSNRIHIILRLIFESTVLCLISCILGLLLAYIFASYASNLLDTEINITKAFNPLTCTIGVSIILLLGFFAGITPAIVISASKPIDVVRGTFRRKTKMVISKFFITFQNAITIILIGVSLTMILQIKHLINAPLGYDTENIISLESYNIDNHDLFINEIKKLPSVKLVSKCKGIPIDGGNNNTNVMNGKTISWQIFFGDKNYFKIFGLGLEQDNKLEDEEAAYINNRALSDMGLNKDATDFYFFEGKKTGIRGILKDFHLRDIEAKQNPIIVWIKKEINDPWQIVVKVTGDPIKAYNDIKSVYKRLFNREYVGDHPFIDQKIQLHYDRQIRLSKIVSLFAFIAIIISMLGLLAMSTYFIQQRCQEIALRKVFGSSNKEILNKLICTFMTYVGIAFIIAVPILYYFMSNWLSDYKYRIDLSWWIFAIAGLFCFIISFFAVFIQSYNAANSNPVNSLKQN